MSDEPAGVPVGPTPEQLDGLAELVRRSTPSNERLKELAAQHPPSPEWLEGQEEPLFDGRNP